MGSPQDHANENKHTVWTICEHRLVEMMKRAKAGEDIDQIVMEAYANAKHVYTYEDPDNDV